MNKQSTTRPFGNTDLKISPIGLGTWQFSKRKNLAGKFWPALSEEDSAQIVQISYENGINWFDTAELYGNGESERTLARSLNKIPVGDEDVVIATKWSPLFRTANSIISTFSERQEALGAYSISLNQVHNPMSFSTIKKEMEAMAKLADQKKIKYIGVSNFSASQMRKAHEELARHGYTLASNQVQYNLIQRKIERNEILKTAKELGTAIIAYSPLAQGLLSGKFHVNPENIKTKQGFTNGLPTFKRKNLDKTRPLINTLKQIAEKHDVTAAQVALNWLINYHGDLVFAIPGASNTAQALSNAESMSFRLSDEEMNLIDQESRMVQI